MKLKVTVHGVAYEVDVEVLDEGNGAAPSLPSICQHEHRTAPCASNVSAPRQATTPAPVPPVHAAAANGMVISPIAGTVIEVKCKEGDQVEKGQALIIVEAMKMETEISSPSDGRIKTLEVSGGNAIREGQTVARIE